MGPGAQQPSQRTLWAIAGNAGDDERVLEGVGDGELDEKSVEGKMLSDLAVGR